MVGKLHSWTSMAPVGWALPARCLAWARTCNASLPIRPTASLLSIALRLAAGCTPRSVGCVCQSAVKSLEEVLGAGVVPGRVEQVGGLVV